MVDTEKIKSYLIENPINRKAADPYGEAAEHFDTDRERIRNIYRRLREKGLVESDKTSNYSQTVSGEDNTITLQGNTAQLTKTFNKPIVIKSIDDLAAVCDIDKKEWEITKGECKKREVLVKDSAGNSSYKPIFAVSASLKKLDIKNDKQAQLDILKDVFSQPTPKYEYKKNVIKKEYLYEISIPDVHFGKLAHRDETGEDYDIRIATERYNTAINELLQSVHVDSIERILLPIGNDMVHIDSRRSETFEGTRQDSDSRFYKIVRTVKNVIIDNINRLTRIAPVDVLVIPGNHDPETMFMIGEMLDAYYHANENVKVNNNPTPRKYYQYGRNGFMYTHGNEEKHGDLGLIFATEKPQLWADTSFRTVKLGHLHKRRKTEYISVDEYTGFQIQVLPSLSGTDAWHNSKGYMAKKGAKGFLYHPTKGLVAEVNYNI